MDIIRGTANIKPQHKQQTITIGNFDGVHLGHQFVIKQLIDKARSSGTKALVMTFEPHPAKFFQPDIEAPRLTPFRQKMEYLAELGVDGVIVLRFNKQLAKLTGRAFVEQILHDHLEVKNLLVGHDFYFGAKRSGNFELLADLASTLDYQVSELPVFSVGDHRISSTDLRQALQAGDIERLRDLLDRPYQVRAKVVRGDGRGRTWGFPTANLPMSSSQCPLPYGIYVVKAISVRYGRLNAVASYGVRPTVANGLRPLLEVHVLDGNYDFYHDWLGVEFLHRLRDELAFADFDELKTAIAKDCDAAREYFAAD